MKRFSIDLKNNDFDADELHLIIENRIESGKSNDYLESLIEYAEENEIDITELHKYISPTLKELLYVEACKKGLIRDPNVGTLDKYEV